MALLLVAVALFGLAIGSFLNVVIYRVPQGVSLSHPPSRCPSCEAPIRNRHNLPVLGWLLLRGRCADCGNTISAQYPLVELVTAALFVAVAVRLAQLNRLTALPAFLFFVSVGVSLSLIDLHVRRLPNSIVYLAYPVLAVLLGAAAVVGHDAKCLQRAAVGAVALLLFYLALAFLHPAGMGMGDVKLAGVIGLALGSLSYSILIVGATAAFLLGSIVGIAAILGGAATAKSSLPFGPFMITGALLALFVAGPVSGFYSRVILHA